MPQRKAPPATLDDIEPITLPSGHTLDPRQSLACVLKCTTEQSDAQIAKACGYTNTRSLQRFLRSTAGRDGVASASRHHLAHAGAVGLRTLVQMAESRATPARERVAAASKLVDIAGLTRHGEAGESTGPSGREVNIQINIPNATGSEMVDVTERGGGGKNDRSGPCDPTPPDKMQEVPDRG